MEWMNFIWIMHNERVADRIAAPAQIPLSEQKILYTYTRSWNGKSYSGLIELNFVSAQLQINHMRPIHIEKPHI